MKFLVDTGADPNIIDKYGESCLHAALHGHCSTATLQEMLEHGADVNNVNKDGATPLLLACSTAQADAVMLLLEERADPNIAYSDGDASLHAAIAADCSKETIQEIIDYGAYVNAVNSRGRTALLLGCFYRQMDSVKVLLEAGADPTVADEEGFSCLHAAIDGHCSKDTLQGLIDHGAHIDATRKDGTNAFLRACRTGQSESVMFLIEAGADVGFTKPDGNTCLHLAVKGECSKESLQQIIEQGMINVNAVNKRNETALLLACASTQEESVKLMLQNGSDTNIADACGYTSRHAAVHGCCTSNTLQEIITHEVLLDAQNICGNTALWLACLYRQQDSVMILLEAGSNPNTANDDGVTCLHAAITGGCSKKIIHKIIDHGANVNAKNKRNETALTLACSYKNEGAINILLNSNADPNIAEDTYGEISLHKAARQECSKEVLQAIIDHGANVNATNKGKNTALMTACINKNESAINVLLNAGSDPNIADDTDGNTCLYTAVQQECCIEVLQAIIDHGANVNATKKDKNTALMTACINKNESAINVLLNAGANPNIADNTYGDTCLYTAVQQECSKEVLQAIIDHGANVNAANKRNQTALTLACLDTNEGVINVLLNAGSDPNIADDTDGNTCLYTAVQQECCIEVLQAIIDHGANVNATNKGKNTALMTACINKNESAINVLLNAGANPNIADDTYGDTCLYTAVQQECCKEVLQAIIDHGANVNAANKRNQTALTLACLDTNEGVINVLLNAGSDPNIADDTDGNTCLYTAVQQECCIEVLQAIIDHGANVNATNKDKNTALMTACINKNESAINVLLNAGANPNIADDTYGDTCLYTAVQQECSKEVLQAIIDHGANVNAANKRNQTALTLACLDTNEGVINVLLNAGSDPNIADDTDGNTCLYTAVQQECCIEVLQAIIDHGANVNATNKGKNTSLMTACINKNESAINVLLNAGSDPNIADDTDGNTCLYTAVQQECCIEVLQAIIDHGANVNAKNKKNETALTLACLNKNEDAINVLLNASADPDIADDTYGDTCLYTAVQQECCIEVLQAIIDHGANVNATDKRNGTALMTACQSGEVDKVNVLLNAGADHNIVNNLGETCLHYAAYGESSKNLLAYIDQCTDVNVTNMTKNSALVLLCHKPDLFAMSVLKSLTDPNIANTKENTLLYKPVHDHVSKELLQAVTGFGAELHVLSKESAAAQSLTCNPGHRESMNMLLKAGADTIIVDVFGDTCLHKILLREYLSLEYDHETLQLLLDHGVPVNATNKNQQTAYMWACDQGNIDAMCALLKAGADPKSTCEVNDSSLQRTDDGCSSNVTLQTIKKWLDPAWHYLDLPALDITESLSFNLVSRIMNNMMRHVICSKRCTSST